MNTNDNNNAKNNNSNHRDNNKNSYGTASDNTLRTIGRTVISTIMTATMRTRTTMIVMMPAVAINSSDAKLIHALSEVPASCPSIPNIVLHVYTLRPVPYEDILTLVKP